jgi:hypothetical protein
MLIRGWVYVMFNEAMPDLVKVGFTLKDPILRAAELDSTGSPIAPKVVYEVLIVSPRDVEQSVHAKLKPKHEGKEWFRCSADEAICAIRDTIAEHGKTILLESVTDEWISVAKRRLRDLLKVNPQYWSRDHHDEVNAIERELSKENRRRRAR